LRPASRASSELNSWALPDSCAARPPLAAISRCLSSSIEAKPRLLLPWFWFWLAMESLLGVSRPIGGSDHLPDPPLDGGGTTANVMSCAGTRFLMHSPRKQIHRRGHGMPAVVLEPGVNAARRYVQVQRRLHAGVTARLIRIAKVEPSATTRCCHASSCHCICK
jgi:hypothetical protein